MLYLFLLTVQKVSQGSIAATVFEFHFGVTVRIVELLRKKKVAARSYIIRKSSVLARNDSK